MKHRRIYVASSRRNQWQPGVVTSLRNAGHEVYDFRNPAPGNKGFAWSEVDREWLKWTPTQFATQLCTSKVAQAGFALDKAALDWCDTCVLVLPCGRSAHLELGYAAGQGKDTYVLLHEDKFEPELMYLLNTGCATDVSQIILWLSMREPGDVARWHAENGAHFRDPSSHAERLLHEVVELCVATGSLRGNIESAVQLELLKAEQREGFGGTDEAGVTDEWADCAILLETFRALAKIDGHQAIRDKLDVLWRRRWVADFGGALWRP